MNEIIGADPAPDAARAAAGVTRRRLAYVAPAAAVVGLAALFASRLGVDPSRRSRRSLSSSKRMRLTMMKRSSVVFVLAFTSVTAKEAVTGNLGRGERDFRACASCHSLTPDHNMTGPSLAGVIGRKAGTLGSFQRYSEALKSSGVTWDEPTLDAWLEKPEAFIPGSRMTFPGIRDAQDRADIVAYLKQATTSSRAEAGPSVGVPGDPDLKKLDPENTVTTITYCPDTYRVTTADGQTQDFWERNLRLKTDSSVIGPDKGIPALVGAGMRGDRASVIFSTPEEISAFIKRKC